MMTSVNHKIRIEKDNQDDISENLD